MIDFRETALEMSARYSNIDAAYRAWLFVCAALKGTKKKLTFAYFHNLIVGG